MTYEIIRGFYRVYNTLGYGFLEKVYERALVIELRKQGLVVDSQVQIKVRYDNREVGEYYADLFVNNKIIVEIKSATSICQEHEFQLINYLKATSIEYGLLLNFGEKPQIKRKVFTKKSA